MRDSRRDAGLVGAHEAAEILGWSRNQVAAYYHGRDGKPKAGFPEPVARLKAGPVWRREDIEEYARKRQARQ